jgi:catechol 2,3-dioxygenase-like lactoylglutathione lyase family enzyme
MPPVGGRPAAVKASTLPRLRPDPDDLAPINHGQRPVPGRLSVLTLGVQDLERERSFYQALGWKTRSSAGDFAAFPLGGAVLALYPLASLAAETGLPASNSESFRGFTCAINVEREQQVDAAMRAAAEAGGRVLVEPVKREWGGRSGYFADPEGNVWEVGWIPNASFDERGGLVWPF